MSGDPGSGNYMLEALGMQGMFGANPYSSYPGAMPMPGYADEAPTDSLGRPISSYGGYLAAHPGTTLNSTPAQQPQSGGPLGAFPQGMNGMNAQQFHTALRGAKDQDPNDQMFTNAWFNQGNNLPDNPLLPSAVAGPQQTAAPMTSNTNPSHDAGYLYALSHPDPVPSYGATVPQSAPIGQQQPSVLQSFLAAHGGGAGAGNYNNSGFFQTLANAGSGAKA